MNVYLIEGLDRLGKSTLIDGIQNTCGFHQVVHYEKPKLLEAYINRPQKLLVMPEDREAAMKQRALEEYQYDSFHTMFAMVQSGGYFIMDRAHLGEMVYAPLYRKYNGDYVLELERDHEMDTCYHAKLILLTEDFTKSKHFQDDGQSLGPESARAKEQELFINAFDRSIFKNKQVICVTGEDGNFRPKEDILAEALS
jgi:thymidylate kinase